MAVTKDKDSGLSPMLTKGIDSLNGPIDSMIGVGEKLNTKLQSNLDQVKSMGSGFTTNVVNQLSNATDFARSTSSLIKKVPGVGPKLGSKVDNIVNKISSVKNTAQSAINFKDSSINDFKNVAYGATLGFCTKVGESVRGAMGSVQSAIVSGQAACIAAGNVAANLVSGNLSGALSSLNDVGSSISNIANSLTKGATQAVNIFPTMDWGRIGDKCKIPSGLKSLPGKLSAMQPLCKSIQGTIGDAQKLAETVTDKVGDLKSFVSDFDVSLPSLDVNATPLEVMSAAKDCCSGVTKAIGDKIDFAKDFVTTELSDKGQLYAESKYVLDGIGEIYDTSLTNLTDIKKELTDIKNDFTRTKEVRLFSISTFSARAVTEIDGETATQNAINSIDLLITELEKEKATVIQDYKDTIVLIVDTVVNNLDSLSNELKSDIESINSDLEASFDGILSTLELEQPVTEITIQEKLNTACNMGISRNIQ